MKKQFLQGLQSFLPFLFFLCSLAATAQTNSNHVYVKGYYKSNGTYVKPHYRTAPNSTNRDNFSTQGNTNPYTNKAGWITPDNAPKQTKTPNYSSYSDTYNTERHSSYESTYSHTYHYSSSSNATGTAYDRTYSSELAYNNQYDFDSRLLIENILEDLGYAPGAVDGILTTQTIVAIKNFQRKNGLTMDGRFGPQCVDVAKSYLK